MGQGNEKSEDLVGVVRQLVLISDEPIDSWERDRLGMSEYRDVIVGTVLGSVGPLTIGVYGRWGEGKTSLLRSAESWLRGKVEEETASKRVGEPEYPYVVPVWFNAWQYESEEHPLVPLVAEIERAVEEALREEESIAKRWGKKTVTALKGIAVVGAAVVRAGTLKKSVRAGVPGVGEVATEVTLSGKDFIEGVEKGFEKLKGDEGKAWRELLAQSTYLTIFDRLRELYRKLEMTKPGEERRVPRVAVFVDDLDRCQADKAFELIESIKLVLGQRGFIFVLALDKGIVDAYVEGMWRERLKERYGGEGTRYLDKIVQVPLFLRGHQRGFQTFVEDVLKRLKGAVSVEVLAVFREVMGHLGEVTEFGPRSLVRRVNTLLVDLRLRPKAGELEADGLKEGEFVGLCLVQRTLLDYVDRGVIVAMADDDAFCDTMLTVWRSGERKAGVTVVGAMFEWLDGIRDASRGQIKAQEGGGPLVREVRDTLVHAIWRGWLEKLDASKPCKYVLGTEHGERWLSDRALRELVTDFVGRRAEVKGKEGEKRYEGLAGQRALIERAARKALRLGEGENIEAGRWAEILELNFSDTSLSDVGIEVLSHGETGLRGLKYLVLRNTGVTDAGLKELSNRDTAMKGLVMLDLGNTSITDVGVEALSRGDTGLKALTTLTLSGRGVTDVGLEALSRGDTGLKGLNELLLLDTGMTAKGLKTLSREGTGLEKLTRLELWGPAVTDEGVEALSREDTGLKRLTRLELGRTKVTAEGLEALSRRNTGLKGLTTLDLRGTKVSSEGLAALSRGDVGLLRLARLVLWGSGVTDEGLTILSSGDTGLKRLKTLELWNTVVTDDGLNAVRRRWPGIDVRKRGRTSG